MDDEVREDRKKGLGGRVLVNTEEDDEFLTKVTTSAKMVQTPK